jgi:rRNA maturation protein Nop10
MSYLGYCGKCPWCGSHNVRISEWYTRYSARPIEVCDECGESHVCPDPQGWHSNDCWHKEYRVH